MVFHAGARATLEAALRLWAERSARLRYRAALRSAPLWRRLRIEAGMHRDVGRIVNRPLPPDALF